MVAAASDNIEKVTERFRSLSAAQEHLQKLQNDYSGAAVFIESRRNSKGQFSTRGTKFTFRIEYEEQGGEPPDLEWEEWAITFEYGEE